jgi:hypothetical protein
LVPVVEDISVITIHLLRVVWGLMGLGLVETDRTVGAVALLML